MVGQKGGAEYTSVAVPQMPGHTHTCTPSGIGGCITGLTGSSVPVPILQPYLVMNYVIALQGVFPSRNRRARNLRSDGFSNSNHTTTTSDSTFTSQSAMYPYLGEL